MSLKPFNPKAICSKCGHDQVRADYCTGTKSWKRICYNKELGDHLHRFCDRCHFEWLEMCVNEGYVESIKSNLRTSNCAYCGKQFTLKRNTKKYCNGKCRTRALLQKRTKETLNA